MPMLNYLINPFISYKKLNSCNKKLTLMNSVSFILSARKIIYLLIFLYPSRRSFASFSVFANNSSAISGNARFKDV